MRQRAEPVELHFIQEVGMVERFRNAQEAHRAQRGGIREASPRVWGSLCGTRKTRDEVPDQKQHGDSEHKQHFSLLHPPFTASHEPLPPALLQHRGFPGFLDVEHCVGRAAHLRA